MEKFCGYIHNRAVTSGRMARLQSYLHFAKQNKAEAAGEVRR